MIRFYLVSLFALFTCVIHAQDLISTGGDFFQMESGSISFTIGEPIIETLGNDEHDLTQGFQQSVRDITTGYNRVDDISINIYPNPTSDFINVEFTELQELNYQLFDLNGVLMSQGQISQIESIISLNKYNSAIFILKLFENDLGSRTFQIVKK